MGFLRRLASQSAVYGLSSVVPRLLNYFLVVLHSRVYDKGEYGVLTELYAYIAILMVVLTFGLETGFFRFARTDDPKSGEKTYGTLFYFLAATSTLFFAICWGFCAPISEALGYEGRESLLLITAGILGIDAWSAIIFAKLRWQQRPLVFSSIKIASVVVNVGLNLLFLVGFPKLGLYNAHFGAGYVLLSNLIASLGAFVCGIAVTGWLPPRGSRKELWAILAFSFPLLISGIGGTANEFLDRIFIKWLTPASDAMVELGVYGANAKIAVLVVLFVQMFKYAAEPFFFAQKGKEGDRNIYAIVTQYFTYFIALCAVGIWFAMPVLKHFVGRAFWDGLDVMPFLLLANVLYGLYFNVSFWYKLTKRTWYGVLFTFAGAAITIGVNLWLTPLIGYKGAAIARGCSYAVMIALCLMVGQRCYPIPYNFGKMGLVLLGGLVISVAGGFMDHWPLGAMLLARAALLVAMLEGILRMEGTSLIEMLKRWRRLFR